ncbi:hypothetical protein [Sphingomonas agri]|uniref:hypothetical protein n=1 Tax=Sphingomonas agri TaxID=1813878 RepID=UPI00311FDF00
MADLRLSALLVALALPPAACNKLPQDNPKSSVTVKLPPARPAKPTPGFRGIANSEESLQSR